MANGKFHISDARVAAYEVPTDTEESDGTLTWSSTTMVLVELKAAGVWGLGYTYAHRSVASLIRGPLFDCILGRCGLDIPALWMSMRRKVRNYGTHGLSSMAISAVDNALWDLKARLLDISLSELLGTVRERIPLYGSGGFCNYSPERLERQLGDWAGSGFRAVKMKIGAEPHKDPERVRLARNAIGPDTALFIDANGALTPRQALTVCREICEPCEVSWFEEPVSSDNLEGLRLIREHAGPRIDIAAGEYLSAPDTVQRMLKAECVDVLQADVTRCLGISGFLMIDALCQGADIPLSAHTAPAMHAAVCLAAQKLRHLEYFHDHVRLESMFFDGLPLLEQGMLRLEPQIKGHGLVFRRKDAEAYQVSD
jgi:L-alanine-DL-glutamate epimerase-like enolase superfamily enzyme